jgi:DNA-binding CsgD family transcriptional regulator
LFDPTPAEARVTQGIVRGETIDMLAIAIGVSRETIRTQLKAAMVKTGTSRQAELVGLLASVQMPGT